MGREHRTGPRGRQRRRAGHGVHGQPVQDGVQPLRFQVETSGLGTVPTVALLAGYCLVMVLPALVLLALRAASHDRLTPALARLESRLSRASGEAVAWVLFLLGLYVVVAAFPLT